MTISNERVDTQYIARANRPMNRGVLVLQGPQSQE